MVFSAPDLSPGNFNILFLNLTLTLSVFRKVQKLIEKLVFNKMDL
jgi:hypothetical protein